MIRRATLVLVLLGACGRGPETIAPQTTETRDLPGEQQVSSSLDLDVDNLLNIAYGAGVLFRTAEADLESSAVHAIDGMTNTRWLTPTGDANQTMVFSFAAPARVEQLGFTTVSRAPELPSKGRFEASADARTWREVLTVEPRQQGTPQLTSVTPFEALFLRVTTIEPTEPTAAFNSIHAIGSEIQPPEPKPFGGCWTINGQQAMLEQRGARITGVIEDFTGGGKPTFLDGGTDGRVARLMWMKGPMWGYVAATVAPGGQHLSGLIFHKNPLTGYVAGSWFGERCAGGAATAPASPAAFLGRAGHWSLNGLLFDDREQLVEMMSRDALDALVALLGSAPAKRFRIVAHEFRGANAEENRRRTAARIDALRSALQSRGVDVGRLEFSASGSEWELAETPFAVQRLLWSRVDLVVGR